VRIAAPDVMEIAVAVHHHAVMAEAQAEAKIATEETHVHRAAMDLRVKVAARAAMDLRVKVAARAAMDLRVKVAAHAAMVVIAMVHADSVIVTAHASRSVTGWKSHGMCKSSSSLKTNQPKLWPTTFATAAMLSACSMPHASSLPREIASRPVTPALQSVPRACS
jgi:hypothetical protein